MRKYTLISFLIVFLCSLVSCSHTPENRAEITPSALSWQGEINPTEFDKWQLVQIAMEDDWFICVIVKNWDELSLIPFAALVYRKRDEKIMEYSYFKSEDVYIFKYDEDSDSYKRVVLLPWEKERCLNCHQPKVEGKKI